AMWLRCAQVVGIGFLFVPITLAGYIGVPPEKGNSVSGIINFMRNIGSSVGTSLVTTLIARRSQFHQVHLAANVAPGHATLAQAASTLAAHLTASGVNAERAVTEAYALLYRTLIAQASTLAYIDTFFVLAAGSAIMFLLSFALKKNDPSGRRVVME
ncbi:MAG: DHA2 family efflux MFS transporter permease subunit, partial [Candidatus Sulfotelmatobacter sp.]